MSSGNLVEQLRTWNDPIMSTHWDGCIESHLICDILTAADEVERLRAENERLYGVAVMHELALRERNRALVEIERLRVAGDALALILECLDDAEPAAVDRSLVAREEARGEQ